MKKDFLIAGSLVLLLLVIGFVGKTDNLPTSMVTEDTTSQNQPIVSDVEIKESDLKLCCEFTQDNTKKGCWLLKNYSCDICSELCYGS